MHQFPRSAVRTRTGWVRHGRARGARRPDWTSPRPAQREQKNDRPSPPDRDWPARPGRLPLPPRTAGDRAVDLRRIDGGQLGHPHDHGEAPTRPGQHRSTKRGNLGSNWAGPPATGRPRPAALSIRSSWRRRRRPSARPARRRRSAAAGGWPARRGDSEQLERAEQPAHADVPTLSQYLPAACLANSPALPHATPSWPRGGFASRRNPMCPMDFRRLFAVCPQNSAAPIRPRPRRVAKGIRQNGSERANPTNGGTPGTHWCRRIRTNSKARCRRLAFSPYGAPDRWTSPPTDCRD
jgi:hypothetical protein